jgi:predicted CDP-diglyceride synthetase/phosphatidate cytidylyltransferase
MPRIFYLLAAALLAADAGLSRWRPARPHARRSAAALVIAYAPMLVVPALSPLAITLLSAAIGVVSLVSFARMVGLTRHPRFFVLALLSSLSFYVAARAHWYGLFQAMPVFAMFVVAGAGAVRAEPGGFLQRMCLSWLGLIVYGYLLAHAALFTDTDLGRLPGAAVWLSVILFCAKASDVLWEAARRLGVKGEELQLAVSPAGGALGGAAVYHALPGAFTLAETALLGLVVGLGVGAASRTYKLIVTDVLGEDPARPMKGTMLFGFAFALALAYHLVRYLA